MLRKCINQCIKLNINYNQYKTCTTIPLNNQQKKKHEDQQKFSEKNTSLRIGMPAKSENPINKYKNVSNLDINWSDEPNLLQTEQNLLKPINDNETFQSIVENVAPNLKPTFNLAAYVNKSETLQQLIKLGVDLSRIEKRKGLPQFILKLNFENDIKPRLLFLHHVIGINPDLFGWYITKNPLIFKENIEDIQIRINYLQSKKFTPDQITTIFAKNPFWVMFKTQRIDQRLGFFQKTFKLDGNEMRALVTKQSKLITYNMKSINLINFTIREEMGFNNDEIKSLLLNMPKIWMMERDSLTERFDFVHTIMKISHEQICKTPHVLNCRLFRLKQRHGFLNLLKKAQYDPLKDLYVSLKSLVEGTDEEFVLNVAKSSYLDYDKYLRTL